MNKFRIIGKRTEKSKEYVNSSKKETYIRDLTRLTKGKKNRNSEAAILRKVWAKNLSILKLY